MSHNSRYYVKRLTKKDRKEVPDISKLMKKLQNAPAVSTPVVCEVLVADQISEDKPSSSNGNASSAVQTKSNIRSNTSQSNSDPLLESHPVDVTLTKPSTAQPVDELASSQSKSGSVLPTVSMKVGDTKAPILVKQIHKPKQLDQRKFDIVKYERNFPWLYHSTIKQGYICKFCELFGTTSLVNKPFMHKGVHLGTHPYRTLKIHDSSKSHQFALQRYSLSKSNVNVYRQLHMKAETNKTRNRSAMKKIFKCVDFMIRQKWAVTENAEKFVEFVADLGVEDLKNHVASSSSVKYLSSSSVTEMVACMSDLLERKVLDDLRGKDFALLADESADMANRSQMSVMARFSKSDLTVATHFLGFVKLEKGTAECIMNSLEGFLLAKNIDLAHVRFVAFDGCNTMSGVRTGIPAQSDVVDLLQLAPPKLRKCSRKANKIRRRRNKKKLLERARNSKRAEICVKEAGCLYYQIETIEVIEMGEKEFEIGGSWIEIIEEEDYFEGTQESQAVTDVKTRDCDLLMKTLQHPPSQLPQVHEFAGSMYMEEFCRMREEKENEEQLDYDEIYATVGELTREMENVINNAVSRGNPRQVLVDKFRLRITKGDIATLSGLNWLNDKVIDFYMNMLMERGEKDGNSKVYAFNTFFYKKVKTGGQAAVKNWTRQVDVLAVDYILIPVHLRMHSCLAVIDFKQKDIQYYDSMGRDNQKCLNVLKQYLCDESADKKKTEFNTNGWKCSNIKDIPQQKNGSDCGMFACKYAEYITREAQITFTQADMPCFRREMIYEIVQAKLLALQ